MCKIALASDRLFDQLLNFEAGDAFVGGFLSQLVQHYNSNAWLRSSR